MLIQSVAFRQSKSFSDCPDGSIPEPPTKPDREAASHRFFAHRTDPRFAGKKVFVIRRQQAIMPNHCSSSNVSGYKLLWYCCTCNALWVLRFATQFVMLLAVPPHSSRQLLCPSRHFVHSFLRYASLHHVRSQAICCKAGHPKPTTQSHTHGNAPAFSQANSTILTGFHFASLRYSFTSVAFSPPAALFSCARRQPHLGCVHLAAANCSCRTSISQSIAKVHLHSSAASVP